MPPNVPPGTPGLHGAVWFETLYQDSTDSSGKTLYAVYHNENYPSTLPWDKVSGTGYKNEKWLQGLKGPTSPAAVCRIGIMKSTDGGGPASSPKGGFYWGPSVSWNIYLNCWVMLMAKVTGPSWAGSSIYISFNKNRDLGEKQNSQEWSQPRLLLDKPGYFLWYPSLQPVNTPVDIRNKNTCLRLGQRARLFVKNIRPEKSEYPSEYIIEFNSSAMDEQEIK